MKYCMNCGAPLRNGAKYCTECGTKIPEEDLVPAEVKEEKTEEPVTEEVPEGKEETALVVEEKPAESAAEEAAEQPEPAPETEQLKTETYYTAGPEVKTKKRGLGILKWIAAIVLAFVCGIGGWAVTNLFRKSGNTLAGKWQAVSGGLLTIELEKDGTGLIDNPSYGSEQEITWTADDTQITFMAGTYGIGSTYEYKLDGDTLTIVSTSSAESDMIVLQRK